MFVAEKLIETLGIETSHRKRSSRVTLTQNHGDHHTSGAFRVLPVGEVTNLTVGDIVPPEIVTALDLRARRTYRRADGTAMADDFASHAPGSHRSASN